MCNVLVVENNPTIAKLISYHLGKKGCTITEVYNGLEALLEIDRNIPDIIFTDIIMPKVSGDQLCSIIRNDKRLQHIFIAVHSSASLEDNRQILDLDADIYIAKGPAANIKEHIYHVLDQYQKGIRRSQKIIGAESLHPRAITKELLLARKHYHAIFNNIADAVVEIDINGRLIQANVATQKLFGKSNFEILSTEFTTFIEGAEKEKVLDWLTMIQSGSPHTLVFNSNYDDPLRINNRKILLNLVAITEEDETFIIGIFQDITLQKDTEIRLARTLNEFHAVIETIDYGIVLMDSDFKVRIVNQAYRDLWQIPESFTDTTPTIRELLEFSGNTGLYNVPADQLEDYIEQRYEIMRRGDIGPSELQRSDGKVLQFKCVILPDNGRLLTYYDITSLKNTEKKLEEALEKVSNLANHDPLTGLPNLRLARERLYSALSISKRQGWKAAIMFIDLDGFKAVNDSRGHDIGDKVLQKVAKRLVDNLRQSDTVARIGGDEFLVIQTEVSDRFAAANVAEKIVKSVSEPFEIDGKTISIGASIGIAIYPDNGEDRRVLMKKADDAMYYTKRIGKNNYTFTPD